MYNPEKDFARMIIDCLGKDGKSISALSKDLEARGIKLHRLIITGYLRAMTDQGLLKEKEIPPSKIYIPARPAPEDIYESVNKSCRNVTDDPDEVILYTLNRMFKRPIFESELRKCGVMRPIGREANDHEIAESRRLLKRAGNVVPSEKAVFPVKEFEDLYYLVLTDLALDTRGSKHLVLGTKQTKLM